MGKVIIYFIFKGVTVQGHFSFCKVFLYIYITTHRLLPKSEMRTRGNKLPDFNLHFKMRYSKKELAESATVIPKGAKGIKPHASLSNILRPAQNIFSNGQANSKKRGRVRLELIPAFTLSDFPPDVKEDESRSIKCEKSRADDTQSYSYSSDDSDEVNLSPSKRML